MGDRHTEKQKQKHLSVGRLTHSFVWSVEVQVHDVADASLQHVLLVVGVHETHELGVLQRVQQELGHPGLVLLSSHMHHIITAALLKTCPTAQHWR